jgi:hypothetical protein
MTPAGRTIHCWVQTGAGSNIARLRTTLGRLARPALDPPEVAVFEDGPNRR